MVALLGLCCMLYMTWGARAPWGFVLPFRGTKLAALLLVGVSVSTATLMFQTITQNRILTPSIMGFDALYVFLLTSAVFAFGGMNFVQVQPQITFLVAAVALTCASLLLFSTMLITARSDLLRMVLTGIIFGALCRSLTSFLQRMMDPNEFAVVQVASFARFTQIETDLLALAAVITSFVFARAWQLRHRLDVLALGRGTAITLGEPPRRLELEVLILIAILVSVSTALVGPVAFLGLLVVSIARLITRTETHRYLFPSAALIAGVTLVGGQLLMERVFQLTTPLSVVIDLVGGLVFLMLLLKGLRR
ncbi:Petrobactin ABC transporter, permease protein II [Candidatus Rhodobacter oscarellae]|uniref:Petrobactin ABC transporter, permease protein II n=2 Tax=Candidatus Rhodobacter oscarellae TaxID=1675527 RepID=A0A0J9E0F3_9RHOB|nr:Petrobactin ABC transporter, permease protein II [Candidatus Rhodobacter lobularis]